MMLEEKFGVGERDHQKGNEIGKVLLLNRFQNLDLSASSCSSFM
jgi:hypothetical protein